MRNFARTYVAALAILSALAVLTAWAIGYLAHVSRGDAGPRPTLAGQVAYDLEYRFGDGSVVRIRVDVEARACDALASSSLLVSACALTTFVDTAVIATDAHGELNAMDTGAFLAIVWRARLDGQPDECDHSGLLGDRLAGCRAAAVSPSYDITDAGITVRVDGPTVHPSSP